MGGARQRKGKSYTKLKLYYSHTQAILSLALPLIILHAHACKVFNLERRTARAERQVLGTALYLRAKCVAKCQTIQVDSIAVTIGS